jgi:hypothetical protein
MAAALRVVASICGVIVLGGMDGGQIDPGGGTPNAETPQTRQGAAKVSELRLVG